MRSQRCLCGILGSEAGAAEYRAASNILFKAMGQQQRMLQTELGAPRALQRAPLYP